MRPPRNAFRGNAVDALMLLDGAAPHTLCAHGSKPPSSARVARPTEIFFTARSGFPLPGPGHIIGNPMKRGISKLENDRNLPAMSKSPMTCFQLTPDRTPWMSWPDVKPYRR